MHHEIQIHSLEELQSAAKAFLEEIGDNRLVAFYAPMGAGKTTFTSALCQELGVEGETISSPTFAIVNEYRGSGGKVIYHFDFYRIHDLAEALDIGLYEYLDSGAMCIMEWPENIEPLLPEETLRTHISVAEDGTRTIAW